MNPVIYRVRGMVRWVYLRTGRGSDLLRHGLNCHYGVVDGAINESKTDRTRYDTRCYFNVRSKADMSQINLPHGNDN